MPYRAVTRPFGTRDDVKPAYGEMVVYVDEHGEPQMVDFLCPCRCGNACPTHVVPIADKMAGKNKDAWTNSCWGFDLATLTIYPSIRWTGGCRAHFNITNGRTVWHGDSGVGRILPKGLTPPKE